MPGPYYILAAYCEMPGVGYSISAPSEYGASRMDASQGTAPAE